MSTIPPITSSDTISSISTPVGEGGIGIIRLSGRNSLHIAGMIFQSVNGIAVADQPTHTIHYGCIIDPADGLKIDEVMLSVMLAPKSYTVEDVVEINCHSGVVVLKRILGLTIRMGARLADPGEFTRRAFLNGRIDLVQVEAVIDIIRAKTSAAADAASLQLSGRLSGRFASIRNKVSNILVQVEASIDFSEEEIDLFTHDQLALSVADAAADIGGLIQTATKGRMLRDGITISIAGRPNVGKSSLLNTLLQDDKAIVTNLPGTTRDLVSEYFQINGLPVRLTDTAGLRETTDIIESEGIKRSRQSIENCRLVLHVIDNSAPLELEDEKILIMLQEKSKQTVIVLNKLDRPARLDRKKVAGLLPDAAICPVSAITGEGIQQLKDVVYELLTSGENTETVMVTSLRQETALSAALTALDTMPDYENEEIIAIHLREALDHIGAIIGTATPEDILNRIFDGFCVGK